MKFFGIFSKKTTRENAPVTNPPPQPEVSAAEKNHSALDEAKKRQMLEEIVQQRFPSLTPEIQEAAVRGAMKADETIRLLQDTTDPGRAIGCARSVVGRYADCLEKAGYPFLPPVPFDTGMLPEPKDNIMDAIQCLSVADFRNKDAIAVYKDMYRWLAVFQIGVDSALETMTAKTGGLQPRDTEMLKSTVKEAQAALSAYNVGLDTSRVELEVLTMEFDSFLATLTSLAPKSP